MNTLTQPLPFASTSTASGDASLFKRLGVLGYGIGSYAVGCTALAAWILIMLGVLEFPGGPFSFSTWGAVAFDAALMIGFGLQHSIMARPSFKKIWTKIIPQATERSTYVLATGVALAPVLALWQPMSTTLWNVEAPIFRTTLTILSVVGWAYLFVATFAINHFELFGLRQVYEYFRGRPVTDVPFKERLMYRFDRHPIMTGALMGMWITPTMQLDHLLFAVFATLYIMVGVYFEERSLRRRWGATYLDYCDRVHSIVPTFSSRAN